MERSAGGVHYHCQKIHKNKNHLTRVQKRLNGRILFFGKCRSIDTGSKYFLEFFTNFKLPEKIDSSIVDILNKRFNNNTKQEIKIDSENSCEKIRSVSKKMNNIIQYLIGISAAFSEQYDEAILILKELLHTIEGSQASKYDINLCKEIKSFISESYRMKAFETYDKENYSFEEETIKYLKESRNYNPDNFYTHELLSIYYFIQGRNIEKAILHNKQLRSHKGSAWRFSHAFLEAYRGNIYISHKIYMSIFKKYEADNTDSEVLDFIAFFDNLENHFGLKYLLILLYYYRYNNFEVAIEYAYECIEMKELVDSNTFKFFIEKVKTMQNMPDDIKCITIS